MSTNTAFITTLTPLSQRFNYAVRWPFGVAINANTGRPLRRVARFTDPSARDEWVYQGNPYKNSSDFREIVYRREVEPDMRQAAMWEGDPETGIEWLI